VVGLDMKKHLSINGWHIVVDYKLDEKKESIIQVVVRYNKNRIFHLTFHEQNEKDPRRTHVVIEKEKNYQLIIDWKENKENLVAMHWLYLPKDQPILKSRRKKYDFILNSNYNYVALSFWIAPIDATLVDNRHVYQCLDSEASEHKCKVPHQSFHSLVKCINNELSIELLETCCFAIKRDKYDLTKRSIDSIVNNFLVINKDGEFEMQRKIDKSIFPVSQ
jgi:hypothetical protein